MLFAQRMYLRRIHSQEGKHAALGSDEAEIPLRTRTGKVLHQLVTQAGDSVAHGRELRYPLPAAGWVTEDLVHDRSPMIRRHRIDAARDAHKVGQDCITRRGG